MGEGGRERGREVTKEVDGMDGMGEEMVQIPPICIEGDVHGWQQLGSGEMILPGGNAKC